jgi:hypothetical protein
MYTNDCVLHIDTHLSLSPISAPQFHFFFFLFLELQKYYFKTDPRQRYVLFGLVEQRTVPGTKLLCSGFWGTARYSTCSMGIPWYRPTCCVVNACSSIIASIERKVYTKRRVLFLLRLLFE